jgi:hypothetical protein
MAGPSALAEILEQEEWNRRLNRAHIAWTEEGHEGPLDMRFFEEFEARFKTAAELSRKRMLRMSHLRDSLERNEEELKQLGFGEPIQATVSLVRNNVLRRLDEEFPDR